MIGAGTAPLIPKLRGQFAEFLKDGSLERLRLRASPTCVSFSTDSLFATAAFLGPSASHFGNKSASPFREPSRLMVGCDWEGRTTG